MVSEDSFFHLSHDKRSYRMRGKLFVRNCQTGFVRHADYGGQYVHCGRNLAVDKGEIYAIRREEKDMLYSRFPEHGPGGRMPPADAFIFIFGHPSFLGRSDRKKGAVW